MTETGNAIILSDDEAGHAELLWQLRARPDIEFIDNLAGQRAALLKLTPEPTEDILAESPHWIYFPWRRSVLAMLGPRAFRRLRLDRNRNLITLGEQNRLGELRIGVVGLSVGHVIAHTLAAQGICGELRLTDFDVLELSNLNRVPATVFDEGHNKAIVAARRIAELDPYLPVRAETSGLTPETIDAFLDGLDIVVEVCDSLDTKVLLREAARARHIPVLMATSDRGLIDVERFDLDPARPILHGLLGDVQTAGLAGLTSADKVPHVLGILDAGQLSARMAASLCEVGETLSTWPQLAGEVTLGASLITEAVRRIGLGETLPSGRVRIDIGAEMAHSTDPYSAQQDHADEAIPDLDQGEFASVPAVMAAAATRAPSGGNAQPWQIETGRDSLTVRIDPARTTMMDVEFRGSAVALGAAVFNARVAAASRGHGTEVTVTGGGERSPLEAVVSLSGAADPELAALYAPMLDRATNRHRGSGTEISPHVAELLRAKASHFGVRLHLLTARSEIEAGASVLAAADRLRYLTPTLHAEMFSELWWPGDPAPEYGIDVRGLELPASDLAVLDVLRRADVMAQLARWDAGGVLGSDTRDRVVAGSALAVVSFAGGTLADYARAGEAVEAVWITAQLHGLAVQPVSPAFLYAHDDNELASLTPTFTGELRSLQYTFRKLIGAEPQEAQALVLRFTEAPPPSVRSRRQSPPRQTVSP
ncbi:Rv1355c family protein [Mycolicibacterium fluoranthenivorans]|uniref:Rv1355c family protein n=1 Tax=Mycolicibacterium fluoranthenivorans TaxID=258505 RepID=A0A7G8PLX4_9MYCO|nr:Rv1355c family protein [Mycolicibacterium fluoranthenivorans]QNJ95340.1 Rv1355c family protein [Mycolicibacterium fluoranthenivorans]